MNPQLSQVALQVVQLLMGAGGTVTAAAIRSALAELIVNDEAALATLIAGLPNNLPVSTAQQAAINSAVAGILGGAPDQLNTLKELADALNDDASFAATLTSALALKVNTALVGANNGIAPLNSTGKVPAANLDSVFTAAAANAGGDVVNLLDFYSGGTPGTGGDDTANIEAAAAQAFTTSATRRLILPGGRTYRYGGSGLTGAAVDFTGFDIEAQGAVNVILGASSYFILRSRPVGDLSLRGIAFNGGLGAVRLTNAGNNVNPFYTVQRCKFIDYTKAAISTEAVDMPFWFVRENLFQGANYTTTIGLALGGIPDGSEIENNAFVKNRVAIKMRRGGTAGTIRRNDFFSNDAYAGTPRTAIWIVPATSEPIGYGLTVSLNKFGGENRDAADMIGLYADEGSGTDITDKWPALGADSTGIIDGHDWIDNKYSGPGAAIIHSTTPLVRNTRINGEVFGATPVRALSIRTPLPDSLAHGNVFGPFTSAAGDLNAVPMIIDGPGGLVDPASLMSSPSKPVSIPGGGDLAGYTRLLTTAIRSATVTATATLSDVMDSIGGIDATEVTFATLNDLIYLSCAAPHVTGVPVYIEIDLQQGSSSALSALSIDYVQNDGVSTLFHLSRTIVPSSRARRERFVFTPPTTYAGAGALFLSRRSVATGTKVKVGRVRIYQAREPIPVWIQDGVLPVVASLAASSSYANDAAAASGGVQVGGVYRNGSALQVRVS